ncbi:MAG: hypothetical protein JXR63_03455 [Spirochaetales bacterium]|nr:hypothetical protein [Spirochaetales bacterium]
MTLVIISDDSFVVEKLKLIFKRINAKLLIFDTPSKVLEILKSLEPEAIIVNTRDFYESEIHEIIEKSEGFRGIKRVLLGNIAKSDPENRVTTLDLDSIHFANNVIDACGFYNKSKKILFTHPISKLLLSGEISEEIEDNITITSDNAAETSTLAANIDLNSCTFYKNNSIISKNAVILSNAKKLKLRLL